MSNETLIGRNAEGEKIYVSADVRRENGREVVTLAFQGVIVRKGGSLSRDGDWISSGQISRDELRGLVSYAQGWDAESATRLADAWGRWHLNTMRAGCEHQRAEGWDKRPIDPSKPTNSYGLHFEGQRYASWNLLGWVNPTEHPDGLLTVPCPTCGYGYGTGWQAEEVPADVLAFVAERLGATYEDAGDGPDPAATYKIVRYYADDDRDSETIATGQTLEDAKAHCNREDTHGEGWFDGFAQE